MGLNGCQWEKVKKVLIFSKNFLNAKDTREKQHFFKLLWIVGALFLLFLRFVNKLGKNQKPVDFFQNMC